jgi:hypothetical protein
MQKPRDRVKPTPKCNALHAAEPATSLAATGPPLLPSPSRGRARYKDDAELTIAAAISDIRAGA